LLFLTLSPEFNPGVKNLVHCSGIIAVNPFSYSKFSYQGGAAKRSNQAHQLGCSADNSVTLQVSQNMLDTGH